MDDINATKAEWVRAALRQHEGPLIRYATQITGDVDRARDVVQDTFLRLCGQEPEQLKDSLPQWLFTVCRNRALDLKRKESRMSPLEQIEVEAYESPGLSPAATVEQRESTNDVLRLLATLPANQQEVIRLKFQSGLSYQEISQITSLTVTNVGFLIHSAIKTIRRKLASESRPETNLLRRNV